MHVPGIFLGQHSYIEVQLFLYILCHQVGWIFFQILIRRVFFQVVGENFGQKRAAGRSRYFFGSILWPVYIHIPVMTFLEISVLSRCGPRVDMCILTFQSQMDYALL